MHLLGGCQPDGALFTQILEAAARDPRSRALEVVGRLTTHNQVCGTSFFPAVGSSGEPEVDGEGDGAAQSLPATAGVLAVFLGDSAAVVSSDGTVTPTGHHGSVISSGGPAGCACVRLCAMSCVRACVLVCVCACGRLRTPCVVLFREPSLLSSFLCAMGVVSGELLRIEYIAGDFGARLPPPSSKATWPVVFAHPADACSTLTNPPESLQGAIVVVERCVSCIVGRRSLVLTPVLPLGWTGVEPEDFLFVVLWKPLPPSPTLPRVPISGVVVLLTPSTSKW